MTLRSMTGHGSASWRSQGIRIEVNISSVNRRQLDVAIRLPKMLAAWEPRLEELVGKYVSRGRVSGSVDMVLSGEWIRRGARVDADLAKGYVQAMRKTARALGLRDDLGASVLARLPEVVRYDESGAAPSALWSRVEKCMARALEKLVRAREQEGRYLLRDFDRRLRKLETAAAAIGKRAPQVIARYREQLVSRLRQAGVATETTDERLLRELVLFSDRADISEEITRLKSHIAQFRAWLRSEETVGRTLDFAVQEMFREVNTIGSKANDVAIS